jgi:hypothetical protein
MSSPWKKSGWGAVNARFEMYLDNVGATGILDSFDLVLFDAG